MSEAELTLQQPKLSRSQHLIWMGQRLAPRTPLYNMVMAFDIEGPLDREAFCSAFHYLVASSEVLRLCDRGDQPPVASEPDPSGKRSEQILELVDARDRGSAWVRRWIQDRAECPVEEGTPYLDCALISLGDEHHVWYLGQHHLITDAWSATLVFRRLAQLYRCFRTSSTPPALDSYPAYGDYLEHEQRTQQTPRFSKAEAHWRAQTSEPYEPVPFYGYRPGPRSARSERVPCPLGPERSARLRELASRPGVRALTPELSCFQLLATVLFAWLYRVGSERRDLAILAPVHNRSSAAFKETIGLFIEVLPLRLQLDEKETFESLLKKVRKGYQAFLINALPGTSRATQSRSFDVLLNYIPSSFTDFDGQEVQTQWIHPGHGDSAHSIRLQVHDLDASGEFLLHFDFNCDVFGVKQRPAAVRHFLALLDGLLDRQDAPLRTIDLLGEEERQALLAAPAEERRDIPWGTVVEGLRAQVAQTPEATALTFSEQSLSYRELGAAVDRRAAQLRDAGVGTGELVAVLLPRSPEFVTSIFSILACRAAYLPLEPGLPASRIEQLLQQSGARTLLTEQERLPSLELPEGLRSLTIEEGFQGDSASPPASPSEPAAHPEPADLAYVIYTSGSTGQPKGVAIDHAPLANYVDWAIRQYAHPSPKAFALFSPLSVDLTITSIFVPLLSGGSLRIYPSDEDGHDLAVLDVFEDDQVDVVKLTPSHLNLLQSHGRLQSKRLETLVVGGEDFPRRLAQRVQDQVGERLTIYNEYGPTEATVACSLHRFEDVHETGLSVPIGKPIAGARLYLLDDALRLVPPGMEGDLWIAGPGLARGYLDDPSRTAERFLDDPFVPGTRMYQSGDRARIDTATGALVYLGRSDEQVKIRGARVELGEIQATLESHPAIQAAAPVMVDVAVNRGRLQAPEEAWKNVRHCVRCGLASNHPDAHLDEEGVCAVCVEYEGYREAAQGYFRDMDELRLRLGDAHRDQRAPGEPDCMMLLSGGKDSTYALYQLVALGKRPLVFSLDNGYISDSAKANIRRVVEDLGLELVFAETPSMNAIFADSLKRFSNVCQGCFKTIYTLSTQLARQRGLRHIVTGLSRGQIFETRLAGFFRNGITDPDEVDRMIVDARKAYHRVDDAVSRQLDVTLFDNDEIFEEVQFVDFYRYCDVPLSEVLRFIREEAAWKRPEDTGRSTNCLINDSGIYVHKRERGYHNYALPYSWDVRLGHKTRDECLAELDDEIDLAKVQRILQEVGADDESRAAEDQESSLVAYYVLEEPDSDRAPGTSELRAFLGDLLPPYMVPSHFVPLAELPLTTAGKLDRAALPAPGSEVESNASQVEYSAPQDDAERVIAKVWQEVLGLEQVGREDNFMDLGGDSILSIQVVARTREAGYRIQPKQIFAHPTVASLAAVAELDEVRAAARLSDPYAEVSGPVPLTPIQRWFFEGVGSEPKGCAQTYVLKFEQALDLAALAGALSGLLRHHDALRLRFRNQGGAWSQEIAPADLTVVEILAFDGSVADAEQELLKRMDLQEGCLLGAARLSGSETTLVLAVHHLGIDAVSWGPLLEDLDRLYRAAQAELPPKTLSWKAWASHLQSAAAEDAWLGGLPAWRRALAASSPEEIPGHRRDEAKHSVSLEVGDFPSFASHQGSLPELMLASFAHAYAAKTSSPALRIDVEGHGRSAPQAERSDLVLDTSRTVGWFTTLYPIDASVTPGPESVTQTSRDIQRQLKAAEGGHGFGLLRYLCPDPSVRAQLSQASGSSVLFNYLGSVQSWNGQAQSFSIQRGLDVAWCPTAPRSHALEFLGWLDQGQLHLELRYSNASPIAASIPLLAEDTLEHLRRMLTSDGDAAESLAPADFPQADLSQSDLDDILGEFGDI